MNTWTRARAECRCGRCGDKVYVDQPVLEILLPGLRRVLRRCEPCARRDGREGPGWLPYRERPPAPPEPPAPRFGSVAALARHFDYQRRRLAEDL